MKIYILGISGMLGSKLFHEFLKKKYKVRGSLRTIPKKFLRYKSNIDSDIDVNNILKLKKKILKFKPDILINCIGVIKQKVDQSEEKNIFYINSVFPHELYKISNMINSKLIHFSTDCVFDGKKGNYNEESIANAYDIYGISKSLGELNLKNSLTIRTSIIGHELNSNNSLLEWFLQLKKDKCYGYVHAYFSGMPTIEVFNFLEKFILKNKKISGIYNLSSTKISKYNLLKKISNIYSKKIKIIKSKKLKIDRSLNSNKLKELVKYKCPSWDDLIKNMYINQFKDLK
jgi:dTDP-4-dehydrorhamnose reductase